MKSAVGVMKTAVKFGAAKTRFFVGIGLVVSVAIVCSVVIAQDGGGSDDTANKIVDEATAKILDAAAKAVSEAAKKAPEGSTDYIWATILTGLCGVCWRLVIVIGKFMKINQDFAESIVEIQRETVEAQGKHLKYLDALDQSMVKIAERLDDLSSEGKKRAEAVVELIQASTRTITGRIDETSEKIGKLRQDLT